MGESIGKPVVPKKQAFIQIEREALHEWARFMMKNQRAASVLGHMAALMDKQAAVVISQKTLAKLCRCGLNTAKRALDALEKGRWIQVVQLGPTGSVNAYVINSRVAWCDLRDNKKMAIFSARIVADAEDQTVVTMSGDKLRRIPIVYPPEEALPAGEWPLGAQVQLPGLETVAVGHSDEAAE
jgi:hypothetical protein